jgi:hypothetical protein
MKYLFYALIFSSLFLAACKKETKTETRIIPASAAFAIKIDQVINDTTIVLKWSKYAANDFKKYVLSYSGKVFIDGRGQIVSGVLKEIANPDELSFEVRGMPYSEEVSYYLNVLTEDMKKPLFFYVTHFRTTAYSSARFNDVQINKTAKRLYLTNFNPGTVISYDYQAGRVDKSVGIGKTIGWVDAGNYAGKPEVYVPTVDGWLLILDGLSLEQKDRIYVGGRSITSVECFDDKLFVSSSDQTYGSSHEGGVKIYSRADKKLLGVTGYYNNTRLLHLEGSVYDLVDITTNISPVQLYGYRIAGTGVPVSKFEDSYHGDFDMDPAILKSFPSGGKFITSARGSIFNRDLIFQKSIAGPYGASYSDFDFNESGSSIYCASKSTPKVTEIRYTDLSEVRTFQTKINPFRVFRDGDQLLVLSREESFDQGRVAFFVEKFKL